LETRGTPRKHRGLLLRIGNVFIVLLVIGVLVLGIYEAYAAWTDPRTSAVNYAVNWLNDTTGGLPVPANRPSPAATPTPAE
jgi:hypothetical protein